ncbi:MAG: c-type cytochrome domain-containing protein [Bacteroidota bacterium]
MLLLESSLSLFFGRFHPVFVHLPIGFLLIGVLMEFFNSNARSKNMDTAIVFSFRLGALSAFVAAGMGWLLANEGGYNESHLFWHRWLGIGVGVLSVLALVVKGGLFNMSSLVYKGLLVVMIGMLMATGHLGGNMTHGATYLTEYLPFGKNKKSLERKSFSDPDSVAIYADIIQPMFKQTCFECHNADKANGGLRMHTPELLMAGGDGGPILVSGKAVDSELYKRITKDPNSRKFMPTGGRTHLGYKEVQLVEWWIDQGASFEASVAEADIPKDIKRILEDDFNVSLVKKSYVETASVAAIESATFEEIRALGFTGNPLASGNNFLDIRYNKLGSTPSKADVEKLLDAKEQITWLNLANQQITDDMLPVIGQLTSLTRLQLQQNPISDNGITALSSLKNLETLNLYGTDITDAALSALEKLPNLKKVFLWQTNVTADGIEDLKAKMPKLSVTMGQAISAKS